MKKIPKLSKEALAEIKKIRAEVSDVFLAAGVPPSSIDLDILVHNEIQAVMQAFIRIRTAQALDMPITGDEGEEWESSE